MKYCHKILKRLIVCSFILIASSSYTAFAADRGVINENGVNLRGSSSTDSDVLTTLTEGQKIDILSKEGDFFKVALDGYDNAYVSAEFIDVTKAEGVITEGGVNIRKHPSVDGEVIGKGNTGDQVEVLAQEGDWYTISFDGGQAYINSEFLMGNALELLPKITTSNEQEEDDDEQDLSESIYAVVVSDDGVNVRQSASQESEILSVAPNGGVFDVLEIGEKWTRVLLDGQEGFVNSEFISVRRGAKPSRGLSSNSRGKEVINYAKQFLGTPYQWAGTNLNRGVDCSGFVYAVMKHYDVHLNRSSRDQVNNGVSIDKNDLVAGDLVFFDTDGKNNGAISHVGIYMGDGQFIHSSSSRKTWGVTISSLNESYYIRTYVAANRVLR